MDRKKLTGLEAFQAVLDGETVEFGERYYKLIDNEICYSDDMKSWNTSNISVNIFLMNHWYLVN